MTDGMPYKDPEKRRASLHKSSVKWRAGNPAKVRASNRKSYAKHRAANLEKERKRKRANEQRRRAANPERERANERRRAAANPVKHRERNAKWRADNPEQHNANQAARRAAKLKATPKWLTDAQKQKIVDIFGLAKDCGYHVDHIVPLVNKNVCGLHVPWNLQILHPIENLSKGNRLNIINEGNKHNA